MTKLRIAVIGASGRTGGEVVRALAGHERMALAAALVSPSCPTLGTQSPIPGVTYASDLRSGIVAADAVVDFSTPAASLAGAAICAELGKPALIATTGFSPEEEQELKAHSSRIPLILCANTSIGVAVLRRLAVEAQRFLPPGFDVEISEAHHRGKKDAPSGTALALARALQHGMDREIVADRSSRKAARGEREIGISSIRGGDVVGEHTIHFLGPAERLELTHKVQSRAVFAYGALTLVERLATLRPGFYSVDELVTQEK